MRKTLPACLAMTLICFLLFNSSCKKKTITQKLQLHLHANVDSNEIDLGGAYANAEGRNISFSNIRYYISNVKMIDETGATVDIPGTILYHSGEENYEVGEIPVGNYKSIAFDIGVPAADNHSNPASHESGDPLGVQDPAMYFSPENGYIFMDLEGMVDSFDTGHGVPQRAFTYMLGTDALRKRIIMPVHSSTFKVSEGNNITVHMIADFSLLLKGIDMKNVYKVNPLTDLHDATLLDNNLSNTFSYEQ